MRTAIPLTVLATALTCSLGSAPAHARARVFVASYGNDSNPCTFGSPCKTFQQAVNAVDAGGEVTAIDSAGFGPIAITKAVTITSPDGVEAGIVASAGADAIDINAGANDAIVLRGLTLDGGGVANNGIVLNSGGSLTITNCVGQNFVSDGILVPPTSGSINFVVTNTNLWNNGDAGIGVFLGGTAALYGVIDHVVTTNNFGGIQLISGSSGTVNVAISNSISSNNSGSGIEGGTITNGNGAVTVSIDTVTTNRNGFPQNFSRIDFAGVATVLLNRSVIQGNAIGITNTTSNNTFYSYGNNLIDLNTQNFVGTAINSTVRLR
jgi:hypothetical protein